MKYNLVLCNSFNFLYVGKCFIFKPAKRKTNRHDPNTLLCV